MRTLYQITAELYQEHVVPIINGKQYDTGRSVQITLTDAGAVVVPEAGDMLRLYCRKPDGTVSYLPGTLSGTAVEVALTNQLQALPGVVECELQIGTGAEMVSTPVFRFNVLPSNYDAAAIESSDEFGALETALQTVQQYDTRIAALEDVADGLGDASTYGVANDLTQQTAGENVLDAAQGKALGDRLTTAEGDIDTLNDGYAQLNEVKDISSRLTVSAGWNVQARKCGKLVTLVFYTDTDVTLYNQYINVCTLPSDLRPAMFIRFTAFDNKATSANSVVTGTINSTNGNMNVWTYYANTKPSGCVEFLVN